MFKKIISMSVLLVLLVQLTPFSYAALKDKIQNEEVKQKVEEVEQNIPDEVKDQISTVAFQAAYKILDTAFTKSLIVLTKVETKLSTQSKLAEDQQKIVTDLITELKVFLTDEQTKLAAAESVDDLMVIKDDLIAELTKVSQEVKTLVVDNSDEMIAKAELALDALELQCGVDTTDARASLAEFEEAISSLEEGESLTQEEIQAKMQEFDPEALQKQIMTLQTEMNSLSAECNVQ